MAELGIQFGLGVSVLVGYGILLRQLIKRDSKQIMDVYMQREDFVDRVWESRLDPAHLRAAGVTMGLSVPPMPVPNR